MLCHTRTPQDLAYGATNAVYALLFFLLLFLQTLEVKWMK